MCVIRRTMMMGGAALLAVASTAFAAPPSRIAADPLVAYLQEEDTQSRAQVMALLKDEGRPPCTALRSYAANPVSRVRENAVRAMTEAGCTEIEAYSGYLLDGSAGVVDALIDAARRGLMADAVPFLLGCLSDRRRIVTREGDGSIGERAQRALMVITCQSFHYDPTASRNDQRDSITRWRQWYLARRGLSRDEWVQEGIERARDYARRDYGPHRLEGLRLLALIGPKALPALREMLARRPADLTAEVACAPDEPPRPGDAIPCALVVRNSANHALAIAPAPEGPRVRLLPGGEPTEKTPQPRAGLPHDTGTEADLETLADRLVDLAPGEYRRFEFTAGPVLSPGRYRLRVEVDDMASRLIVPGAAAPEMIEAETIVRFEQ